MKNNLLSWLQSIGVDEQRALIYLTALSQGETTATDLAQALHMTRTTMYDNLRALEERGLVRIVRQGKRKLFIPLHPKELFKRLEQQKEQLKDLLPDFLSIFAGTSKQPFVQTFQGPYAAREVYEDILSVTKQEYVYFSPPQETIQTVQKDYITKWIERRVKKGISARALRVSAKDINDGQFGENEAQKRKVRYLPAYVDLKSTIYIYENNLGVISTRKEGASFIIRSPDLAYSVKQLFEFLWSISLRTK